MFYFSFNIQSTTVSGTWSAHNIHNDMLHCMMIIMMLCCFTVCGQSTVWSSRRISIITLFAALRGDDFIRFQST